MGRPLSTKQSQCQDNPQPHHILSGLRGAAMLFLSFTLANLMASLSLSRALWKYAT